MTKNSEAVRLLLDAFEGLELSPAELVQVAQELGRRRCLECGGPPKDKSGEYCQCTALTPEQRSVRSETARAVAEVFEDTLPGESL